MAVLVRLRLLTAQRGGEVHSAKWEEMDLTAGWWTIPGERSKNGHSYDAEKRAALDYWGNRLEQIVSEERGAKVLAFVARA